MRKGPLALGLFLELCSLEQSIIIFVCFSNFQVKNEAANTQEELKPVMFSLAKTNYFPFHAWVCTSVPQTTVVLEAACGEGVWLHVSESLLNSLNNDIHKFYPTGNIFIIHVLLDCYKFLRKSQDESQGQMWYDFMETHVYSPRHHGSHLCASSFWLPR